MQDMLTAARKIERYVRDSTFEGFCQNELIQDAVIRQLTIIGEAASHVPEEISAMAPEIPWRSIRGLRNVVIHEYFGINLRVLWKTTTRNIPDLIARLEILLDKPA